MVAESFGWDRVDLVRTLEGCGFVLEEKLENTGGVEWWEHEECRELRFLVYPENSVSRASILRLLELVDKLRKTPEIGGHGRQGG